jgi:hypothetical protein
MVFSFRKLQRGRVKMGLSYNPKPAFIEALIEAGSAHFLSGVSELFAFAAEFEAAGGESPPANTNIDKSIWQFARAVDKFRSLLSSLEGIEVAPQTQQMLRELIGRPNFEPRLAGPILGPTQQLSEIIAAARGGDPKGPIRIFTERMQRTLESTRQLQTEVENGTCSARTVQTVLSSAIDCYLIGSYIAEFNLLSRQEFAPP